MILQHPEGEACTVGASLSPPGEPGGLSKPMPSRGGACVGAVPPREPIYHLSVLFFFFFFSFLIFTFFFFSPAAGKDLLGSEDAESSSSGRGRSGRVTVFNFNCLKEDKTAACVCVCAPAGDL